METIYTTFATKIRKYEVCRFTGTWETIETYYAETDEEAIADIKADFAGATETLIIFCALRWVLTLAPSAYCPEYDFR